MNHVIIRVFNLIIRVFVSGKSAAYQQNHHHFERTTDNQQAIRRKKENKKTGNSTEMTFFFFMQNRSAIKFLADKNDTLSLNISSEKSYIVQKKKKQQI